MRDQMLLLDKYRIGVKQGKQGRINDKISKLENIHKQEIYLKRNFKETSTGKVTTNVEDLMSTDKIILLKGEAGAGKSSLAAKVVQQWAEGKILKNITCFLMLGAGSDD